MIFRLLKNLKTIPYVFSKGAKRVIVTTKNGNFGVSECKLPWTSKQTIILKYFVGTV